MDKININRDRVERIKEIYIQEITELIIARERCYPEECRIAKDEIRLEKIDSLLS